MLWVASQLALWKLAASQCSKIVCYKIVVNLFWNLPDRRISVLFASQLDIQNPPDILAVNSSGASVEVSKSNWSRSNETVPLSHHRNQSLVIRYDRLCCTGQFLAKEAAVFMHSSILWVSAPLRKSECSVWHRFEVWWQMFFQYNFYTWLLSNLFWIIICFYITKTTTGSIFNWFKHVYCEFDT